MTNETIAIDENALRRLQFYSKRDDATGCLVWKDDRAVYGRLTYRGKCYMAHRLSYIAHRGPIPNGLFVCHKCDNPRCIEIQHLFLGTASDNMYDMHEKGRRTYARPVFMPGAVINERQAAEIKLRLARGEGTRTILAAMADTPVTRHILTRIRRGVAWRHVQPAEEI
jgi:hypothetical protein